MTALVVAPLSTASARPRHTGDSASSEDDLAHEAQNPIASMISVPLQNNFDFGIGPADAFRYTLNLQPVIPIALSSDWNLITRAIVPLVAEEAPVEGASDELGLGDMLLTLFFGPASSGALTWGVGPAISLPSATSDALGSEQLSLGPSVIVLTAPKPWTVGVLANHVWSVAGSDERADVSSTYLQPFASYTLPTASSVTAALEATHDWENSDWSVPVILGVSQVLRVAGQAGSLGLFGKYWAEDSEGGPDWGMRAVVTLLFPEGSKQRGVAARE